MKKLLGIILTFTCLLIICATAAFAASQSMKVRQPQYNFDFDVYRTNDMQANWYKTYDEYYVTKRNDGNWVYGKAGGQGLMMTNIVVGSVNPAHVAELNTALTNKKIANEMVMKLLKEKLDRGEISQETWLAAQVTMELVRAGQESGDMVEIE